MAALAAAFLEVWTLVAGPTAAQAPPRMFSPWYTEALRGILELEESDAARLEQQLAANPDDFPARLKLMAYHQRADRAIHPEDRAKRTRHALWLIERLLWGEHCANGKKLDRQGGLSLERIVLDHHPGLFAEPDRQQARRTLGIGG